ncbi:MAG: IS4 family transposase [Cyclobacteriaceae bacterium]
MRRLLLSIMTFKTALQRDLDRLYKQLYREDFNIREVTKGALSQARSKLNPWAFERLNQVAVDQFYTRTEVYQWYGYRLLAVDGTRLMLPNHPTVKEDFGVHQFGPHANAPRSMALGSMLYDVLNHLTIDARLAPYSGSERDLLMEHLEHVYDHDLLLLDRGYPCFWLLFLLQAKGINYCVRMKDNWWLAVKEFVDSGEESRVIELHLPAKDQDKLAEYPHYHDRTISARLIRVELDNGQVEVLCTSLIDGEAFKTDEFRQLYHYRWNEEEAYKLLKARAELEKFSGKTSLAIQQDFHAKVFLMTMCAAFAHPIEEKVRKEYKTGQNRKYNQKINRTNALATMVDIIVPLLGRKRIRDSIEAFDQIVYQTREIIRTGRSNPRPKKPKRPYHQNYKPL